MENDTSFYEGWCVGWGMLEKQEKPEKKGEKKW